jgi:hypothetical protein
MDPKTDPPVLLLTLSGGARPAPAADLLTGKAMAITDVDTITLWADSTTQIRVDVHGLAAPERGHGDGPAPPA